MLVRLQCAWHSKLDSYVDKYFGQSAGGCPYVFAFEARPCLGLYSCLVGRITCLLRGLFTNGGRDHRIRHERNKCGPGHRSYQIFILIRVASGGCISKCRWIVCGSLNVVRRSLDVAHGALNVARGSLNVVHPLIQIHWHRGIES